MRFSLSKRGVFSRPRVRCGEGRKGYGVIKIAWLLQATCGRGGDAVTRTQDARTDGLNDVLRGHRDMDDVAFVNEVILVHDARGPDAVEVDDDGGILPAVLAGATDTDLLRPGSVMETGFDECAQDGVAAGPWKASLAGDAKAKDVVELVVGNDLIFHPGENLGRGVLKDRFISFDVLGSGTGGLTTG